MGHEKCGNCKESDRLDQMTKNASLGLFGSKNCTKEFQARPKNTEINHKLNPSGISPVIESKYVDL